MFTRRLYLQSVGVTVTACFAGCCAIAVFGGFVLFKEFFGNGYCVLQG